MFKTPTFGEKKPASVLAAVAGAQTPWIKELWPDPAALFRADDARRQLWFAVGAQLALRPERAEVSEAPVPTIHRLAGFQFAPTLHSR